MKEVVTISWASDHGYPLLTGPLLLYAGMQLPVIGSLHSDFA